MNTRALRSRSRHGYTLPYFRDHANAACGVEVMLATGDVMRTGMGALNTDTWQEYQHGFGQDAAANTTDRSRAEHLEQASLPVD